MDIHPSVRHLHATLDLLTLSDKAIHTYSLGRQRTLDTIEMARIARGISDTELDTQPSIYTVVNTSSPLRLDAPMIEGILELSARNQPVVLTPFTLAGAMAPVTLAGALAQQNAEALAGITLTQTVRRGAPVMYGGFTSQRRYASRGAPAFGTPEFLQAALVGGQMARRRYDLPYRSSNVNASNGVDLQAAYESMFSALGRGDGRRQPGVPRGRMARRRIAVIVREDGAGRRTVADDLRRSRADGRRRRHAGARGHRRGRPGGHFFGIGHTQARFRDAFHVPMLSDWRNFESWDEAGRPDPAHRTEVLAKEFLDAYERPPIDLAVREELEGFVARRVSEGGVATDY